MLKKAVSTLLVMFLLCTSGIAVFAHDVPDLEASGTITIHMKSGDHALNSGALTFYRVGELTEDNGNYDFRLTVPFADCGASLDEIHSPKTAETLADYAMQQNLTGTTAAIENGIVRLEISPGQLGLYLVVQHQPADGWQVLSPFLVSVPNMENGNYVYQVDATPKVGELVPEPIQPEETPPADPTLPQTGQLNWPIPVLVVLGLILFAAGWVLRFHGKR